MNISESFTFQEFAAALIHLKPGKAPGPDSICPELIIHAGAALKSWFVSLFFFLPAPPQSLEKSQIPLPKLEIPKHEILKVWRRALVVAIPKPKKPVEDPKSYRSISLLCVTYKILKRLIHAGF